MQTGAKERGGLGGIVEGLRLFRREPVDPEPYYRFLAQQVVDRLPFSLDGARVLDLGSGPGHLTRALVEEGASAICLELDVDDARRSAAVAPAVRADAQLLPFRDGAFDVVFSSNVLEHIPDAQQVLIEVERVLRPGGWGWISWTNWYSPWGGHDIAPLHYLGPTFGMKAWKRLIGPTRGPTVPFDGLWPLHIGPTLRFIHRRPGIELIDAVPRYYPSQRWIVRVPGLRELITWNCLLMFVRREGVDTG